MSTKKERTFDAIVVGSGISGGWAAKELSEKGLKTLVLEKGRETKRFDWIRGHQVGGRSLVWGRQSYRLSQMDFEANAKEGIAIDWPIRYDDMAPWYDYVERFAGISGQNEGLRQLPDGQYLPPMELNCVEQHVREQMKEKFDDRILTIGRTAHLTQEHNGRGKCQFRNRCMRGCPFGGYFSSNASTLPAAAATGNMTLRPNSVVTELIYDKDTKKATGVRIIDSESRETIEYYAKVVFLCASAFPTTQILMMSANDVWEGGIGSASGELGHNIMDHHFKVGARGRFDGFEDKYHKGRRPNGFYIPRFRNLPWQPSTKKDFLRGYGYQGGAGRSGWQHYVAEMNIGQNVQEMVKQPGPWTMGMNGFGECLPYHENKMTLNKDVLDIYGLPTLTFDAEWKENEYKMRKDMATSAAEILEASGFKDIETYDDHSYPGLGIHEMGTARMGRDPKTSVLNKHNQVWDAQNVFVTDGAAMTSAGCQNPSLTYMALTARAANFAVEELKKGNL